MTSTLSGRCLCDYTPRTFDAECCNILCNFAEIVVRDAERYAAEDGVGLTSPLGSAMSTGARPGGVKRCSCAAVGWGCHMV